MYNFYLLYIIAVMFVCPIIAICVEKFFFKRESSFQILVELIAKWFIFWAVGIRLLTAGFSQAINPVFTGSILNVGEPCFVAIKELGFANISMGLIACLSLFLPTWRKAGGVCGGLYLGIAGFLHISRLAEGINVNESIAMISDLCIFSIVILYLVDSIRVSRSKPSG
jgi:hypothetical protein